MEKPNFEEVVRSLLVFLKGQVPSLQTKTIPEDVVRQIQAIGTFLRSSITQIEAAASFDPKNTKEYREYLAELDGLKKSNQRLEESLFMEMSKSQRLSEDLGRQKLTTDSLEKHLRDFPEKVAGLESIIAGLNQQLKSRSLETPSPVKAIHENALKALHMEKINLTRLYEEAQREARALRDELKALKSDHELLRERTKSHELTLALEKTTRSTLEREFETEKSRTAKLQEIVEAEKVNRRKLEEKQGIIQDLQETVDGLNRELNAAKSTEVVKNITSAYIAKIGHMEKTVAEYQKKLAEKTTQEEIQPEKIEGLLKDKLMMEQRIIDLEATLRRLTAARLKQTQEEDRQALLFGSEECIFFFEIFSMIKEKLARNIEYNDLRFKAEEALSILIKTHAIEQIPTVGYTCMENLHKPVKVFLAPFLDDGTIIHEANHGYRFQEHVFQRALVWIAKSKFKCSACSAISRPQDSFCPKCGLELCAPDGSPKRKLMSMPSTPEVCLPVIDSLIRQEDLMRAGEVIRIVLKENPDDSECQKRRVLVERLKNEKKI